MMGLLNIKFLLGLNFVIAFSALGVACKETGSDIIQPPPGPETIPTIVRYISKADESIKFSNQEGGISNSGNNDLPTIELDPEIKYQTIDGFGFALTGGSALHIHNMTKSNKAALLNELFSTNGSSIGVSYLRISLGASDLDEEVFSYNDLPQGETDIELEYFSLENDKRYLIPVLKDIVDINPSINIMASPWSAPAWMKTNKASKGGELNPEYYETYAQYFVKYVKGMADEGITINAVTVQNEPLHDGNNPSMYMPHEDQAKFVANHLGPAFENAGINTKIIIYDHNADKPEYPISILNNDDANKYIDGSAFHLYGGDINNLSQVHNAHPDKNLYFTEQWIGAPGNFPDDIKWHIQNIVIGATRNWCKAVIEWNLASNSELKPHTPGGCDQCLGALTIDGNKVTRNPSYYIIAHASKFVRPDSKRIASNTLDELANVAFENTDGDIVLIVLNNSESKQTFNLKLNDEMIKTTLAAGAVGTYLWEKYKTLQVI
ncbi:MAG: hypothetical protein PF541_01085 [Prolixibacteraceae bacterium]|jgi:glucosylceramidase|nr:hypothetical protein [Prolixibacteraceae bacterium]